MLRRRIIFAADFSEASQPAFELACSLSRVWKARLVITHVNDSRLSAEEYGIPETELLEHKLKQIEPPDISVDYEHKLVFGDPAKALVSLAKEIDADLIIMGTHGRKGIDRVFVGSVAEHVLRKSPCPVLTVRQSSLEKQDESKSDRIPKILVPTDFSLFSYAALDYASTLARRLRGRLMILAVDPDWDSETDEQHSQDWQQLLKVLPTEEGVEYSHKILGGRPHERIAEYANQYDYDFVVMGTHGRTGAKRVLMGSVAEQVVRRAKAAVLTIKPTDKRKPVLI